MAGFITSTVPQRIHQRPQLVHNMRRQPSCTYDTILIGTGLSSLSTASLLHLYEPSHKTLLLEAHTTPGGAAHTFKRRCKDGIITFESGPHLFSGLRAGDRNPVGQLFQALDIQPEILEYESWGVILGEKYYRTKVPGDVLLGEVLSERGRKEMHALTEGLKPFGEAAKSLSVACVRGDVGILRVLLPRLPRLVKYLPYTVELSKPFEDVLKRYVKDELTYNLVNLLCFLLAGVGVDRIPLAEVAFMFSEWTEGGLLQRPVGGCMGVVKELIKYIERHGGHVRTCTKVEKILFEDDHVKGVRLVNGETILAKRVISGISALDHSRLLGEECKTEVCESFMHLHGMIREEEVIRTCVGGRLEANYVVVEDIYDDIEKPGNVVLVSIPSVIDKTVAPSGWVVIHAYTPATEPWELWKDMKEGSSEYMKLKQERGKTLYQAMNKIFGCDITQFGEWWIGTPSTHKRFLSRERGSYGSKVDARNAWGGLHVSWERQNHGLLLCGDSAFPGVGVPGVVASAWIAANCCVDITRHVEILNRLRV